MTVVHAGGLARDELPVGGEEEVRMSHQMSGQHGTDGRMAPVLDEIDRNIVELLRADGRISVRKLAEQVNVSRANAYARIERLTASGVITGYHATIDPHRYGYTVSAYLAVKLRQRSWREFTERLADMPEVEHAAMVSGGYDGLLLVRTTDSDALRDVVLDRLQSMPEVMATHTMFILDELHPKH
ncbi:Lrp/AsnC family transcriptional regulator [Actinocrispum sp. NPDC049592]|uniref:Lrp/AsnC family transcriptional regulator n=1 Tax=Actinocrispum sp. NPDC049592 TaxID=3154835 RepID=UPI0034324944